MKKVRYVLFSLVFSLLLSGCLQSNEHLTINADGSGTLEVTQFVSRMAVDMMVNTMRGVAETMTQEMGGMAKTMAKDMGVDKKNIPPDDTFSLPKKSESFKTCSVKDADLYKKAQAVGLNIEIVDCKSEETKDGIKSHYKLKFDDINKLIDSGLMESQFTIFKDEANNLVLVMKENKERAASFKSRRKKGAGQGPPDFDNMPPEAKKIFESLSKFKFDFTVTMPNDLVAVEGMFNQTDSRTAHVGVELDLMKDPDAIMKLYGQDIERTRVVCSSKGILFDIPPAGVSTTLKEDAPDRLAISAETGQEVEVYLQNGKTVKGTLLEKGNDYIKINCFDVPLTYYFEEIDRIK